MPGRAMERLTSAQTRHLRVFLDELARWNRRINLTTVPDSEAWSRHVEETVELLDAAAPEHGARVVDIGSGTGVPGVVIAVVRPDLRLDLVEADVRKAAFLDHVCGVLGLSGVEVVPARAEAIALDPSRREAYDLAVSRAAAPVAVLVEVALPLLRVGGRLCALVADAAAAVREAAAPASHGGGGAPVALGRLVLAVAKTRPSPPEAPRALRRRQRD